MANDMKLQFNIGASFSELKAAAAQAKAELLSLVNTVKQAGQEVKIKVGLDIAGLNSDIQSLKSTVRNALQGSATEKIKVKIEADAAAIRADILAIRPQIQQALGSFAPISLTINHAKLAQHLQAAEAQVRAAIARMTTPMALQVNLNVDAMSTGLIRALHELKAEIERLRLAMHSGQSVGNGGSSAPNVIGSVGNIKNIATTVITVLGIQQLVQAADSAALLDARLKELLDTEQQVVYAKDRLYNAAQRLQVSYEEMTKSAARLIPAMQELGRTPEEAIKLSEILMTTAKLSGATTQEASASAQQFAQALGSGVLQGDELRSILENNQSLARELAAALKLPDSNIKVTIGMLRKLGSEGKITSKVLSDALLNSYDDIMAKTDNLPKTFEGAFTRIKNTIFKVFDDLNQYEVFTGAINSLNALSDKIQELGKDGTIREWASGIFSSVGNAFSQLTGLIGDVFRQITNLWADLTGSVEQQTGLQITALDVLKGAINSVALAFIAARTVINGAMTILKQIVAEVVYFAIKQFIEFGAFFEYWSTNAKSWLDWLATGLMAFATVAQKVLELDFEGAKVAWEKGTSDLEKIVADKAKKLIGIQQKAQSDLNALAQTKQQSRSDTKESLSSAGLKAVDNANTILLPTVKEPRKALEKKSNSQNKDKISVDGGSQKKSDKDILDAEKNKLQSDLSILESNFKAGIIGLHKYFMDKKTLLTQMHQLEIDYLEKQKKAQIDGDKTAIQAKIDAAKKAKEAAIIENNNDYKKEKEDAKKLVEDLQQKVKLDAIVDKFKKLDEELATKREERIEEFKKASLNHYETETEAAKALADFTLDLDKSINQEKAQNNVKRIAEEIKVFTETQANKLKNTETLKDRGQISNPDAKSQTEAINQQTLDGLAAYQERIRALNINDIPETKRLLDELAQKMAEVPVQATTNFDVFFANTNEKLKQTGVEALKSGLSEFFMDIASHAKSGSDAIKDFARGFAQSMAKVAADALATIAVLQILNAVSGGKFQLVNGVIGLKSQHTGGITGIDGQARTANPAWFLAAPRYHAGGIAGLQPGEVPAILQRGEEVLTQKDPRHVANGGGQASSFRIINNLDPNIAHDYMVSSSGEQVIINHIERNSGTIRQILGV